MGRWWHRAVLSLLQVLPWIPSFYVSTFSFPSIVSKLSPFISSKEIQESFLTSCVLPDTVLLSPFKLKRHTHCFHFLTSHPTICFYPLFNLTNPSVLLNLLTISQGFSDLSETLPALHSCDSTSLLSLVVTCQWLFYLLPLCSSLNAEPSQVLSRFIFSSYLAGFTFKHSVLYSNYGEFLCVYEISLFLGLRVLFFLTPFTVLHDQCLLTYWKLWKNKDCIMPFQSRI